MERVKVVYVSFCISGKSSEKYFYKIFSISIFKFSIFGSDL